MVRAVGYQYLIEHFDLKVCELLQASFVTERSQKKIVRRAEFCQVYYAESRIRLKDTWQDNLVFALKNEGVNLEVLKALFGRVLPHEIEALVKDSPQGIYARRIWFLYEWLTGTCLDFEDMKTGNYVRVAEDDLQLVLPDQQSVRARRQRVINNLIGTREFCPLVRHTENLADLSSARLKGMAEDLLRQYSPDLIYRAVHYLFAKETKSSFEIERETPSQRRMEEFVSILSQMSAEPIDEAFLVRLQNQIVDSRYAQKTWRTDQVYVGETMMPGREKVHFVAVRPEDVSPVMSAFLDVLERVLQEGALDAVAVAAVFSFAFVFIHPFDDGNGRIHRYLMHYILARCGFTPKELIFPVSAVLLKKSAEYDRLLESFSRRVMRRLDYEIDDKGEVSVKNESADYYRYIDFTPIVEGFSLIIRETIETEWKEELDYLRGYDEIRRGLREIVDLPDKRANQFILFVQGNGGVLSKRKREYFAELTDEEIARMEEIVRRGSGVISNA